RLATVDRDHTMLIREVNDHKAAAADAGDERLGHAEHGVCGDRGVNGVAALAQDLDAGPRRSRVNTRNGSAGADGHRFLRRRGRCRSLRTARYERNECEECDEHRAHETDAHEPVIAAPPRMPNSQGSPSAVCRTSLGAPATVGAPSL